ncbi:MAG: FmdB family zinc ribbon protein [Saezia sp.]
MPIYAYRCDACGHECDVLQKSSDSAPRCSKCGDEFMSKQITAAAFALKGNGWYKTDFADKKCPALQASESSGQLPPCAASGGCCSKLPE